jgi:hypothetical protein
MSRVLVHGLDPSGPERVLNSHHSDESKLRDNARHGFPSFFTHTLTPRNVRQWPLDPLRACVTTGSTWAFLGSAEKISSRSLTKNSSPETSILPEYHRDMFRIKRLGLISAVQGCRSGNRYAAVSRDICTLRLHSTTDRKSCDSPLSEFLTKCFNVADERNEIGPMLIESSGHILSVPGQSPGFTVEFIDSVTLHRIETATQAHILETDA